MRKADLCLREERRETGSIAPKEYKLERRLSIFRHATCGSTEEQRVSDTTRHFAYYGEAASR